MGNANVLVPGTGGITLADSAGNDLGYPVKMQLGVMSQGLLGKSAQELEQLLSMAHQPGQWAPTKTTLKSGLSIRPGHTLAVAYNQVPKSFIHFLYDWRQDIRQSATELLHFLKTRKPGNGRFNLVGHSQGGLVIVLASKLCDSPDEFQKYVASVVLVGCPLAGTVNAAYALLAGDMMGDAASSSFQKILRTWPALYQMLPAWGAVASPNDKPVPADKQLMQPGGWNGHPHVDKDLLLRARQTSALLRNPLGHMDGDIDVGILMARHRKTKMNLKRNAQRLTKTTTRFEKGDTLVPHALTMRWIGGFAQQFVLTMNQANEHAFLLNDPAVLAEVKALLRK